MATAAATYLWADHKAAIRVFVGLASDDDSEDTNLGLWFDAAVAACDNFVRWTWVDSDDADVTHGSGVKLGIYEYIRALRDHYKRGNVLGVTQRRTGALAENYGGGGLLTGADLALRAARPHWHHDARTTWLQGAEG